MALAQKAFTTKLGKWGIKRWTHTDAVKEDLWWLSISATWVVQALSIAILPLVLQFGLKGNVKLVDRYKFFWVIESKHNLPWNIEGASCHKCFQGILSFSYNWQEKLKISLSSNTSPSPTPAVPHKLGRRLEIIEGFPQGHLLPYESQSWGLTQFFHLGGGYWKSPTSLIPLSQAFLSIDEPKAHWNEKQVQPSGTY